MYIRMYIHICKKHCKSVQFSLSVVYNSLRPHGLQHPRPPCPSPIPWVYSNSCPSTEKAMAARSSTLAWKIPWMEEPGRLQSMGSLRVGQDWAASLSLFTFMHWRRKWQPTPVFLTGESRDGGAWWAAVYGVAQSRTWLKRLSSSNSSSMSIELVMPPNHLILCHPLLLPPSIFPSIRVFSNESALRIRWPKYWSFSFSISPSNEYSGLISFRMDWLDLLAVQGTLKSLQQHSSKASILWHSAFFIVQLSNLYMTNWKNHSLD